MASIMSEPALVVSVQLLMHIIKQHPVLYDKTNQRSEASAEGSSDDTQLEPPATDNLEVEWSELEASTSSTTTTCTHPTTSSDTSET
ncbi:hypothetical protein HPB52_025090 [Rhipicephalus sanguineus]|uniref:Uncharacterized protein n=1 Tax=Rhipicephalus sanguineus TaxID=34632 RepID=A0A9D4YRS6_RHISA|nr:hypothetical protein HPB52_025090 [Rhipicephalus sanguineus]